METNSLLAVDASADGFDLLSEDYEAVDHRLQLFLDVEVFEEEEELHSFLKVMKSSCRYDSEQTERGLPTKPQLGLDVVRKEDNNM